MQVFSEDTLSLFAFPPAFLPSCPFSPVLSPFTLPFLLCLLFLFPDLYTGSFIFLTRLFVPMSVMQMKLDRILVLTEQELLHLNFKKPTQSLSADSIESFLASGLFDPPPSPWVTCTQNASLEEWANSEQSSEVKTFLSPIREPKFKT